MDGLDDMGGLVLNIINEPIKVRKKRPRVTYGQKKREDPVRSFRRFFVIS